MPDSTKLQQVTPGNAQYPNQMNVEDFGGQIVANPKLATVESTELEDDAAKHQLKGARVKTGLIKHRPGLKPGEQDIDPATYEASLIEGEEKTGAHSYDAKTISDEMANLEGEAAKGTLSEGSQINPDDVTHDIDQIEGEDWLNDYATLEKDEVWDESTVKGQLELLQGEFTDEDGNPTIPSWAAGMARQVSKIASFTGMTGSAATAAMSQALLESSVQIAEKDAAFFQTVQLENLSNEQQSIAQKASILANMHSENMDAKLTAAVENSKAFLEMDLANLSNEQQIDVLELQGRIQSLFEDQAATNAARRFKAEQGQQNDQFWASLNTQVKQYNATALNTAKQYNADNRQASRMFNAQMRDSRQKFEREMQYQIDKDNAQWRQTVQLTNTKMKFDAAVFDTKNRIDISQEQLNRLWNRADSILDYAWKSAENDKELDAALVIAQLQAGTQKDLAKMGLDAEKSAAWGELAANVAGTLLTNLFK